MTENNKSRAKPTTLNELGEFSMSGAKNLFDGSIIDKKRAQTFNNHLYEKLNLNKDIPVKLKRSIVVNEENDEEIDITKTASFILEQYIDEETYLSNLKDMIGVKVPVDFPFATIKVVTKDQNEENSIDLKIYLISSTEKKEMTRNIKSEIIDNVNQITIKTKYSNREFEMFKISVTEGLRIAYEKYKTDLSKNVQEN